MCSWDPHLYERNSKSWPNDTTSTTLTGQHTNQLINKEADCEAVLHRRSTVITKWVFCWNPDNASPVKLLKKLVIMTPSNSFLSDNFALTRPAVSGRHNQAGGKSHQHRRFNTVSNAFARGSGPNNVSGISGPYWGMRSNVRQGRTRRPLS